MSAVSTVGRTLAIRAFELGQVLSTQLTTIELVELAVSVCVCVQKVKAKCLQLEQDLRKSKRREEKLTALQFRLKEDARQLGADPRSACCS